MGVYLGVFLSAFLAATVLPFYSEVAVTAAIVAGSDALTVFAAASIGNTLGAVLNGVLGRLLGLSRTQKILRIKPATMERVGEWFRRYGAWTLLLAWLPVGGDALTVVAGIMRVRWPVFICLVFIGKAARYAVLIHVAGLF